MNNILANINGYIMITIALHLSMPLNIAISIHRSILTNSAQQREWYCTTCMQFGGVVSQVNSMCQKHCQTLYNNCDNLYQGDFKFVISH